MISFHLGWMETSSRSTTVTVGNSTCINHATIDTKIRLSIIHDLSTVPTYTIGVSVNSMARVLAGSQHSFYTFPSPAPTQLQRIDCMHRLLVEECTVQNRNCQASHAPMYCKAFNVDIVLICFHFFSYSSYIQRKLFHNFQILNFCGTIDLHNCNSQ